MQNVNNITVDKRKYSPCLMIIYIIFLTIIKLITLFPKAFCPYTVEQGLQIGPHHKTSSKGGFAHPLNS